MESDENIRKIHDHIVSELREFFKKSGYAKAVIGLSGGIDSSVCACLSATALGPENVLGISLPSRYSSSQSLTDAKGLAANLGIRYLEISIEKMHQDLLDMLAPHFKGLAPDATEENIQARIRAIILMAFANKFRMLLISTGNRTEAVFGYATLYGDTCGAILPIGGLNKKRVYLLGELINSQKEMIPGAVFEKKPSAELRPGQTDEESLGASYDILAPLSDYIMDNRPYADMVAAFPKDIVDKALLMHKASSFKRSQAPPIISIPDKMFSRPYRNK